VITTVDAKPGEMPVSVLKLDGGAIEWTGAMRRAPDKVASRVQVEVADTWASAQKPVASTLKRPYLPTQAMRRKS